ncbi:MAG: hypothetical protein AAGF11_30010 [Myxococcota bacterium]
MSVEQSYGPAEEPTMGILDKAGEKTKSAAEAVGSKVKELLVKSIESLPPDHLADFVEVAAKQKAQVNALLQERGVEARVGQIVVRLGTTPTVDLIISSD